MNARAILYINTHDAYISRFYQTGVCSYKLKTSLRGFMARQICPIHCEIYMKFRLPEMTYITIDFYTSDTCEYSFLSKYMIDYQS